MRESVCMCVVCVFVGEGCLVLLCLSGGVCVCLGGWREGKGGGCGGILFAGLVALFWGGPGLGRGREWRM